MTEKKLRNLFNRISDWCVAHGIGLDVTLDESDIQGVMIFKQDRPKIPALLEYITPYLDGIYLRRQRVRSGDLIVFSLAALSESRLRSLIDDIGETMVQQTWSEQLSEIFGSTIAAPKPQQAAPPRDIKTLLSQSARRLAEAQYKLPTAAVGRTSANRQPMRMERDTVPGPTKVVNSKRPRKPKRKLEEGFSTLSPNFRQQLHEALDGMGMATPSGQQPTELFQKFARALQVLGDALGIGPLQDQLKQQGINWRASQDGTAVILFVQNAATNAPQPIASISAATLENPGDFEEQLSSILDFAKGQAPGTERQRLQQLQNMDKAVRDIARSVAPPQEQSPTTQAMQGGSQMQAPQTTSTAGVAAPQPATGQATQLKPVAAPQPAQV